MAKKHKTTTKEIGGKAVPTNQPAWKGDAKEMPYGVRVLELYNRTVYGVVHGLTVQLVSVSMLQGEAERIAARLNEAWQGGVARGRALATD